MRRPTATYDAGGNKTTTAYTMSNGVTTTVKVTNPLSQATSTSLDPLRGLPVSITDPNSITSTLHYDGLGRLIDVWEYGRATSSPANYIFSYALSNTAPTVVTTQKLNDESAYITSTSLYDALLRPRQTQNPTPQGGILVTDNFYDSRGFEWKANHQWWDSSANPGSTVVTVPDSQVPNQDVTAFDGLGRPVLDTSYDDSAVKSTTATAYYGDRVTTVPPTGGTPTSVVTDALGRKTELDSYTSPPTVGSSTSNNITTVTITGGASQATSYSYNHRGWLADVKDAATGQDWAKGYNLLGQVTSTADPNAGTTTMGYDPNGNLASATDAAGHTISYTYDALNRRTGEYDGPGTSSPQLAAWVYDNSDNAVSGMTDPVGQLTSETSYSGGNAYTIQQKGFNVFGESTGQTVTLPAAEGALAGSYTLTHIYTSTAGLPFKDTYPASPLGTGQTTAALPAETVAYGYETGFDLPAAITSAIGPYSQNITYDAFFRMAQQEIGSTTNNAFITDSYDPHTGALTDSQVANTAVSTTPFDDTSYTYDPAGNITSQQDVRNSASSSGTELQCYTYDLLARLTAAWTTDGAHACSAGASTGSSGTVGDGINGGAYWTSWAFDPLGNQTSQTQHSLTGGTDSVTSYSYNGNGQNQPDTLTKAVTTGPGSGTSTYTYDPAGNTTARNLPAGNQTLTWAHDGKLATATTSNGTSSYIYDADGSLLIQKDPGQVTLHLFGDTQQIVLDTSTGVITGIRLLALPGGGQAVRTGGGSAYTFELGDQHGTGLLTLDSTAASPIWRQYTPYGSPRGTAPTSWPDTNAFLGKPADPSTGLDIIGARNYDPTTGRFISPDPVLDTSRPQTLDGYTYASSNPVTNSDPSGLMLAAPGGGGGCSPSTPGCPGYSSGDGGGYSGCGYTVACGAPWALPPRPRVYMASAGGFQCGHDGLCASQRAVVYHNSNTDWPMLAEFLTGIGSRYQYFNQWDPMTQALKRDSNTSQTIAMIKQQLRNPMWLGVFTHGHPLTGSHNYVDNPNPVDFVMDGLGALTGGRIGHNWADSFTGSYDQQYTVIARGPHTATVYFTVENQTNLNSLLHPKQTWPFVPIISAYFHVTSVSLPWDAGPFSEVDQVFQWQKKINY